MYPVATGSRPARLPAASRVDKATSHLLQGPDWAVNLEICDTLNADRWQTKDVVKAVKKRLQNKDPKVHFFTLTLLETMMKNCGEYVHFEVVEQHILQEMVKIVQKKAVINANIIGPLVHLLQAAEFDIRKEVAWAISNATSGGTHDQIK